MKIWVRATAGVVAALIAFAAVYFGRGFFPGAAVLVGIAVGALVYTALGTAERLGRMYRREGPRSIRRRPSEPGSAPGRGRGSAPDGDPEARS